jgi:hypothetical protein
VTNLLSPPTVRIRVGPAVEGLGRGAGDAIADTEQIMAAIAALLPAEARVLREPTEDELVRTYPKGKVGEERVVGVAPAAPVPKAPARKTSSVKAPAEKKTTSARGNPGSAGRPAARRTR